MDQSPLLRDQGSRKGLEATPQSLNLIANSVRCSKPQYREVEVRLRIGLGW